MHKKQKLIKEDKNFCQKVLAIDCEVQVERIIREIMDDPEVVYRSTALFYQDFFDTLSYS
ncbi:MAG: hypothetical protein PG977_000793 [Bartonella clarridgeiae]|nr:MAG: hypothetical protein PG977_000793 [Bartonella clarridgeiae]